jgi:Domain of unknown function (DUF4278)
MQLVYRGASYKFNLPTGIEVPTKATIGKYRGAVLQIKQPIARSLPNITVLQYRGHHYVKREQLIHQLCNQH